MTKIELRKLYKEKRSALTATEINRLNDLLLIQFQQLNLPFIYYLHTYLAIEENNEVPADQVMSYLEFRNPGLRICVPKVNFTTGELYSYIIDKETDFVKNEFNVLEPLEAELIAPEKLDLILVPLLAFDERGYRVGYGKGFYDRFLSQCRKDAFKIGLSYFDATAVIDDVQQFDLPLTHCVTPHRIYEFN
ncbi:MAG: 5-formyltetrahydrofolate cyclo-ligase [Sphingobacteriales bacterium]|nr:MAG: 5-formyltetrahydrofolate cyclo-ligase [Sphingobacteriales bacterium]